MKCTACQTENIEGAIFCEECGVHLAQGGQPAAQADSRATFALVADDGNKFAIPEQDTVVVGREDPISDAFPDVDLTGLQGIENGVSRKHAVLHCAGQELTIEDMGSTNGTYVNKKRLQPHAPQTIKPGDEVRFGKLALVVQ